MKKPVRIVKRVWKLARRQDPLADRLVERGLLRKRAALSFVWVYYANSQMQLLPHDFYRPQQIGVVSNKYCDLVFAFMTIIYQVRSDIYI